MKPTVTVTYTIYYVIDFSENYGFTKCKRCFNLKTSREIKQVLKSNCIGYNINGKFYSLTNLRKHLIKPKQKQNTILNYDRIIKKGCRISKSNRPNS